MASSPASAAGSHTGTLPTVRRPGLLTVPRLTRRQRDVAALVADGLTNREIAERLVVSERTVDAHIRGIMDRYGLWSRVQVAVLAVVTLGIVPSWMA